jgi:hypothetical protein
MIRTPARYIASVLAAGLLLTPSSFAFDSPLSDQAVREAYFLGQRHDESLASFLGKYIKHLPPPKTGPYISYVTFFTPFAQLAQGSDRHFGNYSAQQAALDHRGQQEFVRIVVEIQLTPTYGAFLVPETSSRSSSLSARPPDFWREFQVQISDDTQVLMPSDSHGSAKYNCGRYGHCSLTGATLEFDFPAATFTSDSATIQVVPPEGEPVSVKFDLSRLR